MKKKNVYKKEKLLGIQDNLGIQQPALVLFFYFTALVCFLVDI